MPLRSRGLNPPLVDWRGRSAWVLGASSGIGRATAEALQAQGAVTATSSEGTSVTTTGPDWASLLRYLGQSSRIARLVGFFSIVTIPDGLDIRRVPMGGGDVDTD